jgi:hypothetical protein
MIAIKDRLFSLLEAILDSGNVMPQWDPASDRGFRYVVAGIPIDEHELERLAQTDHLDRVFVDRLSRCPGCRSQHVNVREICVVCKSSRITPADLLHHFRCGYVAPAYEFKPESDGRRCPKCHGMMRHRGTDHDSPGPHFTCGGCGLSFQVPEIGLLCLGCGLHTHGNDLEKVLYEDVYGYKITSLGTAAVRGGALRIGPKDDVDEPGLPILRRSAFMAFLDDERKRRKRFGSPFSVLLLSNRAPEDAQELELIEAIRAHLSDTDKLGRYDEHHYLALLPMTPAKRAEALARQFNSASPAFARWNLQAQLLRIDDSEVPIERAVASLRAARADV